MTAAALAVSLALAFSGLAALALSLDRHHRAALQTPAVRGRAKALRAAGWCGIGLSFAAAIACGGWAFGPVQWLGALTAAALAVVALLSWRPVWLRAAALAALPVAALVLPLALAG
ncbi:DUF3325 domain-containing protein [Methylobacterium sp. NEAU 140]|uniref:DUF3325 domain-containing protein n=1 Tax=Methylobacterium sp. NEAU 140 TaxID=3064945 RepID=UPI002734B0F9|nr:DUF3325 domain-containing protein [Methylobacterium sp. NEAU 140]MDP4023806.1 DUF3325 domain-containing protein [Methylobacterium sp. NEAU 140]